MKPLIIGYGNPLRSDDGIGWHAAHFLQEKFAPDKARVIAAFQLAPEMARDIADASVVIFVDAATGSAPGTITAKRVLARAEAPRTFTHHFSPAALVACARLLFQKCPPAHLVTITVGDCSPGESLSEPVTAALPMLEREVERILENPSPVLAPGRQSA